MELEAPVDVWRITLATLRRWYIFLPVLALTGGAVYLVGEGVAPEYEVTGTALITPGRTPSPVPNPYGGQDQANAAVAIVLNSAEKRGTVVAEGLVGEYQVSNQSRSTIMNMTVRSGDAERALATGHRIFEMATEELASRQSGAGMPASSQYRLDVLAAPTVVNAVYDGKLQSQAITGLLGASAALLLAVLFDDIVGLYRRGRARRRSRRADHKSSGAAEQSEPAAVDAAATATTDDDDDDVERPATVAAVRERDRSLA